MFYITATVAGRITVVREMANLDHLPTKDGKVVLGPNLKRLGTWDEMKAHGVPKSLYKQLKKLPLEVKLVPVTHEYIEAAKLAA